MGITSQKTVGPVIFRPLECQTRGGAGPPELDASAPAMLQDQTRNQFRSARKVNALEILHNSVIQG